LKAFWFSLLALAPGLLLAQDAPPEPEPEPEKPKASQTFAEWAQREIFDKVDVAGYRRIGYNVREVSGDREAFNVTTSFGQGGETITDVGSLQINGRGLFGGLEFEAGLQQGRFNDPQSQKVTVRWRQGKWQADWGDFQASLVNTNPLTRFTKTVDGVGLAYASGGFEARAVRSDVKGDARTISISGNNTAGPYFLQASQIVRGSERVQVDGEPQSLGQDYSIDYELGTITFVNRISGDSRIIPPTATIVVSYEAFSLFGSQGVLEGAGASYDMGRAGKVGLSVISQKTGQGGGAPTTRQESFQGFGPEGSPYFLQFQPQPGTPVVMRLDGILQVEGVDFRFDTDNPAVFYFNRFVSSASTIIVTYTPLATSTASSDREVVGVDYRLPIGKLGALSLNQATSRTLGAGGQKGTAQSAELALARGGWTARASVRDVPQTFSGIESVGFSRNERLASLGATWQPSEGRRLETGWSNSAIARFNSGTAVTSRYVRTFGRYALSGAAAGGTPLEFNLQQTRGRTSAGETRIDTLGAEASRRAGAWRTALSLKRQFASSPGAAGEPRRSATIDGIDLDFNSLWTGAWVLGGQLGLSQVAEGGDTSLGRDLQARIGWRPTDQLFSSLTYTDSDGGAASAMSGFESGAGFGFDGNGFSGGSSSSFGQTAAKLREWRLQSAWTPSDRASLTAYARSLERQGALSANTRSDGLGLDGSYDAGARLRLNGSMSSNRTRSLSTGGSTENLLLTLGADGDLSRRLDWSANTALLLAGGGAFAQDSLQIDGALRWRLSERESINARLDTNQVRGYLPQNTWDASLTYQRQIFSALAFNAGWTARSAENLDPAVSSGAFRSSGFNIELAFNFGY
jgi:hypothetical protein